MSDQTPAHYQRQNILNNRYALQAAEQHLELGGIAYQGEMVFTKQQVCFHAREISNESATRCTRGELAIGEFGKRVGSDVQREYCASG